jgi:hypothetical protein
MTLEDEFPEVENDEIDIAMDEGDDEDEEINELAPADDRFLKEAKKLRNRNLRNEKSDIKYHNRVVTFKELMLGTFRLPKRDDFLRKDLTDKVTNELSSGKPILFCPFTIHEEHGNVDGDYKYILYLVGILENGAKATVHLNKVEVYFDILVPDEFVNKYGATCGKEFANYIVGLFSDANELRRPHLFVDGALGGAVKGVDKNNAKKVRKNIDAPFKVEIKNMRHFKHFQETPSKFLRLHFNKLYDRKNAIIYFRAAPYKYETASDDLSCHYRKVCRDNMQTLNFAGWARLNDYIIGKTDWKFKSKYNFIVDIDQYKFIPDKELKETHLLKDYFLNLTWDIETYDNYPITSNTVPRACYGDQTLFNTWKWNKDTVMFMACFDFNWWFSDDFVFNVCIVDRPCAKTKDKLTIVCENEKEMIYAIGQLFENMQPDIFGGFNSGDYDIPFLVQTAAEYPSEVSKNGVFNFDSLYNVDVSAKHITAKIPHHDEEKNNAPLLENLLDKLSILKKTNREFNKNSALTFQYAAVTIKLEAGRNITELSIQLPGFICIDVRTIFRKIYNKADKSNLNFYLKENNLGSKFDMPYLKLFYIYKICSLKKYLYELAKEKSAAYVMKLVCQENSGAIHDEIRHESRTVEAFSFDILTKEERMMIAARIHTLSEFYATNIDLDYTKEQAKLIRDRLPEVQRLYPNYSWQNMNEREQFYKVSCLVNLSEFKLEQLTEVQKETLELNAEELLYCDELFALAGEYCHIDSYSCHKLLSCRNVIPDKREMSKMAYCTIADCFFRADGMKVRNIVIAEGQQEKIAFTNISLEQAIAKAKYPGAYVEPPKKGLLKPSPNLEQFYNMIVQECQK